jgi:O-antigen ligase
VNLSELRARIPAINSALLAALFFVIPTHVAPAYFLTLAILILILLEGDLSARLRTLGHSPLPLIFAAYWAVLAISLLWTEDMSWGQRMLRKQTFFLLLPIYLLAARREHFRYYLAAFLGSVAMCVALAWYNWTRLHHFPDLPAGIQVDKSPGDTAPFVDWIMYVPILALAAYLLIHEWFFGPWVPGLRRRWLLGAFLLAVLGNILMSGGRTGVVGMMALFALAVVQRFSRRPLLAGALAAGMIAGTLSAGYALFPLFEERVDRALQQATASDFSSDSSISFRIAYASGALMVFAEHPLIGVGVGDLHDEYLSIDPQPPLEAGRMWNPHNHYLLVLASTGLLGGAVLLLMMGAVLAARTDPCDRIGRIQTALVVLFAVICLAESYLARSNTSLMFVLFSALVARSALDARLARSGLADKAGPVARM